MAETSWCWGGMDDRPRAGPGQSDLFCLLLCADPQMALTSPMSDKEGDDDEFFDAEASVVGDNSGDGSGSDGDDDKSHDGNPPEGDEDHRDHDDNDDAAYNEKRERHEEYEDADDNDDSAELDDSQQSGNTKSNEDVASDAVIPEEPPKPASLGVLDFAETASLSDILVESEQHLDTMFPSSKDISSMPPVTPIPPSSVIFQTERSRLLWSQLIVPPPLQPPNWVKSRIRRLFLVSLGVPVDLDEILPEKKQKKLVLPSFMEPTDAATAGRQTPTNAPADDAAESPTSPLDKNNNGHGQTKGAARPDSIASRASILNEFDIASAHFLATTTDTALDGLTDEELKAHVTALRTVTQHSKILLGHWKGKRHRQVENKEAFEKVIENLVKHARQARK